MTVDERTLDQVARLVAGGRRNVAFTGAGVSVESGIPDFRSAGGLWERFDPADYATIEAFRRDPAKVWQMYREMGELLDRAEPNAAHRALARLEDLGRLEAIITQNIDNLHQEAGSRRVIEFHGNARRLVCSCGRVESAAEVKRRWAAGEDFPPRCRSCGAVLKPDVVLFGEPVPQEASREAMRLVQHPDVLLAVGTSAVVAPASYLPVVASKTGGTIVEINVERTDLTGTYAAYSLFGPAGEVMPALVERVEGLLERDRSPT
ncbi:MAG: NAD-dependent deacylase [Deltaproteobacteria bacterium]|nr:NAD-dependent deacylase [Deltaproteobacteria bacterium]